MERRVNVQFQIGDEVIIKIHSRQGIVKLKKQAKFIKKGLPDEVRINGLDNNFRASAKGTIRPPKEGLLGPRRYIIYPKTLRSNNVKKATETKRSNKEIIAATL